MTSSDSQSCISKPNEHIEKYLDDYCNNMSKKKSNYAVLIAGDWGIGKTQFIKKYIDPLHNIAYISLNGISKTSDLSRVMLNTLLQINAKFSLRMLIKMLIKLFFTVLITVLLISPIQCFIKGIFFLNPITKITKIIEIIEIVVLGIGIGIGIVVWRCWDTVFAFLAEHIATNVVVYKVYSLLFPKNSFVLVFDDLERSTIPIEELLGYINYFVEQQKVKTIIIANTEQIVNRYPKNQEKDKQLGTFNIIKEKIISITFSFTADVDDIVITILNQVETEKLKKKLLDVADQIIKIFNQADYKNFRSLEHSILSFQRLYRDALQHCDNINNNFFWTTLKTFLILSLEHYYSDELETKIWSNMFNYAAKDDEKIKNKYGINLLDMVDQSYLPNMADQLYLGKEIWENIIFKNKIECEKIKTKLENKEWFRLLLDSSSPLDNNTLNRLINKIKSDLKATKVEEEGKVKHIISLLMHFQKEGKIGIININEYIGYAKKNLEKIYKNVAYETLNEMHTNKYDEYTKYLHALEHVFYSKDNDDFKKFIDECQEIRQTVINCRKQNIEAKTKSDN